MKKGCAEFNYGGGWGRRVLIFYQRRILDQSHTAAAAGGMVGSGGVFRDGSGWWA